MSQKRLFHLLKLFFIYSGNSLLLCSLAFFQESTRYHEFRSYHQAVGCIPGDGGGGAVRPTYKMVMYVPPKVKKKGT